MRFGGCNLECRGFGVEYKIKNSDEVKFGCDSFFAVDRSFSKEWNNFINIKEILNIYPKYIKDIVITGGEPLIYSKNNIFIDMLKYLKKNNYRITIETNGTIKLDFIDEFKDIVFSISPKLSNSGELRNIEQDYESIKSLNNLSHDNIYFKFTIDQKAIKNGINNEILNYRNAFEKINIYCMAVSKNKNELELNSSAVAQFCLENGYSYSDRLHIRLWNRERGC